MTRRHVAIGSTRKNKEKKEKYKYDEKEGECVTSTFSRDQEKKKGYQSHGSNSGSNERREGTTRVNTVRNCESISRYFRIYHSFLRP